MLTRTDITDFIIEFNAFVRHSVRFVIEALRQYFGSFLIALILIAGAFALYWLQQRPYFESDILVSYNNQRVSRKAFGEMAEKLNILAHKRSSGELSILLHMPVSQTSAILIVEGKNRSGSPLYEDITEDYQPLTFVVRATDRSIFTPLQTALVNYLSLGPYQQQIGAMELTKLQTRLAYINHDLGKIDTIVDSYCDFLKKTGLTKDSIGGFSNIAALLSFRQRMEDDATELSGRIALQSALSITVIHGFTPADRPEKNRTLIAYGILFAILGAGIVAVTRKILPGRA